jgi:N6-L-threonylcarbamoyladenine synthase
VDVRAQRGNPMAFDFPRPLIGTKNSDFSLSGLKNSARVALDKLDKPLSEQTICDFCASFQAAVCDCVIDRLNNAFLNDDVIDAMPVALVVAGGVAKNSGLRSVLPKIADKNRVKFAAPRLDLCTDNGAMIAWAGIENFLAGKLATSDVQPRPRWNLEELK